MDFLTYHIKSSEIRDIDPANDALVYISDRFELTIEQRYWLAFLYATCYCGPTVFYMYNEFPDFENVNVNRLQRWWNSNKSKCVFQTDRLKIKTMDKFVETFKSYRELIGNKTQQEWFRQIETNDPGLNYNVSYSCCMNIRNFGRFTMFLYLEMINLLTDYKCLPAAIDWAHADNCATGLRYHLNDPNASHEALNAELIRLQKYFEEIGCDHSNIFNIETTLCAYKKFRHGKRYIGYYIDRLRTEIDKMQANVTTGVSWRVLDEFRTETYWPIKKIRKTEIIKKHNMETILIIGNCGTGKTWVAKKLMEDLNLTEAGKVELYKYVTNGQVALLGEYNGHVFDGSDRLSMAIMQSNDAALKHLNGKTIIAEGDRFTNSTFINAFNPIIIKIEGNGSEGRKLRNSEQTERHIKAISTRVSRIEPDYTVKDSEECLQLVLTGLTSGFERRAKLSQQLLW